MSARNEANGTKVPNTCVGADFMSARNGTCPPEMITICPNFANDRVLPGYTGPTQGRPLRTNGAYGTNVAKITSTRVGADFMSARMKQMAQMSPRYQVRT